VIPHPVSDATQGVAPNEVDPVRQLHFYAMLLGSRERVRTLVIGDCFTKPTRVSGMFLRSSMCIQPEVTCDRSSVHVGSLWLSSSHHLQAVDHPILSERHRSLRKDEILIF
jgi:hypothetical protein